MSFKEEYAKLSESQQKYYVCEVKRKIVENIFDSAGKYVIECEDTFFKVISKVLPLTDMWRRIYLTETYFNEFRNISNRSFEIINEWKEIYSKMENELWHTMNEEERDEVYSLLYKYPEEYIFQIQSEKLDYWMGKFESEPEYKKYKEILAMEEEEYYKSHPEVARLF